jgi:hypothetical protein
LRYLSYTVCMSLLVLALLMMMSFAAGVGVARRPGLLGEHMIRATARLEAWAQAARRRRRRCAPSPLPASVVLSSSLADATTEQRSAIEIVGVALPSGDVATLPNEAPDVAPTALLVPEPPAPTVLLVPEPPAPTVLLVPEPPALMAVPSAPEVIAPEPEGPAVLVDLAPASVRFEPVAPRGTQSAALELHAPEWRAAMAAVGDQLAAADVVAVVFVHGTFTGTDPLSAYGLVERVLPSSIGPHVARTLRAKTRWTMERLLGDRGNFGPAYVRLFEEAIRPSGERIPCTDFVWSSENHHVGRLEAALGLVRVLATHAELGAPRNAASPRILVIGHSHAGQIFALVTQLLARSIATDAIMDVARARGIDIAPLESDLAMLARGGRRSNVPGIDFVTFGAPNRYAWATVPNIRALHVIAAPPGGAGEGDWVRRLGAEGSDFPPLGGEDRRINATLASSLGHAGFAPARVANALRGGIGLPTSGEIAFVEYDEQGLLTSGLRHGVYTRMDAMLFHARLVADRLYASPAPTAELLPLSARVWSAIRNTTRSLAPSGPVLDAPKRSDQGK